MCTPNVTIICIPGKIDFFSEVMATLLKKISMNGSEKKFGFCDTTKCTGRIVHNKKLNV